MLSTALMSGTRTSAPVASDDWRDDALCRDADLDLFFPPPEQGGHGRALAYCIACPVQAACLNEVMDAGREEWTEFGIRAGLGPRQRRTLRESGQLPRPPKGTHWEWNEELDGWQLAWGHDSGQG